MKTQIRFELKDGSFTEWQDMQGITPIIAPVDMIKPHFRNKDNKTNITGAIKGCADKETKD